MDSKDDNKRGNRGRDGIDGGRGGNHIYADSPGHLPDAVSPQEVELEGILDVTCPPSTNQQPALSLNSSNYAWGSNFSPIFVPLEEIEDDEAPRPPEMIAASFEGTKGEIIEDGIQQPTLSLNSSNYAWGSNFSPIFVPLEEIEDNEAPRPPEMIAASFEGTRGEIIEDLDTASFPEEQIQACSSSITATHQRFDNPSLPVGAGQDHVETTTPLVQESMPPPRLMSVRSNQSLPFVEAYPVNEEVHEAFLMRDSVAHGWSRIPLKYRAIMLGLVLVAMAAIVAVVVVVLTIGSSPLSPTAPLNTTLESLPTSPHSLTSLSPSPSQPTTSSATTTNFVPTRAPEDFITSELKWTQQGDAIVGDAAGDHFGISMALSADARILVIGASGYDDSAGYAKVYRIEDDGKSRMQLGQTIVGNGPADFFGLSVDVTADGMTIILGSPGRYNDRPGQVRVFTMDADVGLGTYTWEQIGQNITGEMNGDQFGSSVSISEDGKMIAVGAQRNDGNNFMNSGHVRVYQIKESRWENFANDIDGVAFNDHLGFSVSLSADGSTVATGAVHSDNNGNADSGQVMVYRIDSVSSTWKQLGQTMYGNGTLDYFGYSVNISPDGTTLALGSPGWLGANDRQGYVRVFSLVGGNNTDDVSWNQIGEDIVGEARGDHFGSSVSISENGQTIAVSAVGNDGNNKTDSGHVRVYRMENLVSGWKQIGNDINGVETYGNSGYSMSLSADGTTVVIGSPYAVDPKVNFGSDFGHVRVFILK